MAERTEELRRDIDRTRDHMTGTIEAIGDRVSPGRVVERRMGRARRSAKGFGERIMGVPKAAAGAVQSSASDAAGSASSMASSAADSASSLASTAADTVTTAPDRAKEATQGNPLAAGAVAFGLGVLIGSLAPASREEEQLAGRLVEPVKEDLTEMGHQVVDSVKEEVRSDAGELQETAAQAVDEVKQHATEAAQEVRSTATDAASEVKDEAQGAVSSN